MNNIHHNIVFECDYESNEYLPFLDAPLVAGKMALSSELSFGCQFGQASNYIRFFFSPKEDEHA